MRFRARCPMTETTSNIPAHPLTLPLSRSAPLPLRRLLPYAQLIRLPNVFTAIADIGLGALATGSLPGQWLPFVLLALASACLYSAGMVWNDYFDLEQDKRERSFRPLPSERVSPGSAVTLGFGLMLAGVF